MSDVELWYVGSNPNGGPSVFGPRNMIQSQIESLARDVEKQSIALRNAEEAHQKAQTKNLDAIASRNAEKASKTSKAAKAAGLEVQVRTEALAKAKASLEKASMSLKLSNRNRIVR